jgi:hypothetical protein
MSIIKESKIKAWQSIGKALGDMHDYLNELEADEDFGPLFDGSTMEVCLGSAMDHLSEAKAYFESAHERSQWGPQ